MAHVRKQLRAAVAAALTGLPTTGPRVTDHAQTVLRGAAPSLQVQCDGDDAQGATLEPTIIERATRVIVTAYVHGLLPTLHDTLDEIAVEVETALAAGVALGAVHVDCTYAGSALDTDATGEQPVGTLRIEYLAMLYTASNAPDVAL
jgi:hypothetical protein